MRIERNGTERTGKAAGVARRPLAWAAAAALFALAVTGCPNGTDTINDPAAQVTLLDLSDMVAAPVRESEPDTTPIEAKRKDTATDTDIIEYTGTVEWQDVYGTPLAGERVQFALGETYQAVLTLTPAKGFTFKGIGRNGFTYEFPGAVVIHYPDSGVVTIIFPPTAVTRSVTFLNLSRQVTAPVKHTAPDYSDVDRSQYIGKVAWEKWVPEVLDSGEDPTAEGAGDGTEPAAQSGEAGTESEAGEFAPLAEDEDFAANTVYRAVINFAARTGYNFDFTEGEAFYYLLPGESDDAVEARDRVSFEKDEDDDAAAKVIITFPATEMDPSPSPVFTETAIKKTEKGLKSITFTLKEEMAGTWTVYSDETGSAKPDGLTAEVEGTALTLVYSKDVGIPPGDYWVTFLQEGMSESPRVKLSVKKSDTELADDLANIFPEGTVASNGDTAEVDLLKSVVIANYDPGVEGQTWLGREVTIPEGITLNIAREGVTFTLGEDSELTVEGAISTWSSHEYKHERWAYEPTGSGILVTAESRAAAIKGSGVIHLTTQGLLLYVGSGKKITLTDVKLDGYGTKEGLRRHCVTPDIPEGSDGYEEPEYLPMPEWVEYDGDDNVLSYSGGQYHGYPVIQTGQMAVVVMDGEAAVAGNSGGGHGSGGGVYIDGGTFTMKGSASITGNNAGGKYSGIGGGVYASAGTFTMEGSSSVKDNNGGGVSVSSVFEMKGNAEVSGNTGAQQGGGVCVWAGGQFVMSGGSVTGNTAAGNGGGVYSGGTFTMSGFAFVQGNSLDGYQYDLSFTPGAGKGVYVENSAVFVIEGNAKVDADNEVCLGAYLDSCASVTLGTTSLGGTGPVATIDLYFNYDASAGTTLAEQAAAQWKGRPVLLWRAGGSDAFPVDRFTLGRFVRYTSSVTDEEPAITGKIDAATGNLTAE